MNQAPTKNYTTKCEDKSIPYIKKNRPLAEKIVNWMNQDLRM